MVRAEGCWFRRGAATVQIVELVATDAIDGLVALVGDEAKAARLARVRVAHDDAIDNLAEIACKETQGHVSASRVASQGGRVGGGGGGHVNCGKWVVQVAAVHWRGEPH